MASGYLQSKILNNDRIFVLENTPDAYDEIIIKDYVEGTLDEDVEKILTLPYIHRRVLVIFKHPLSNFDSAAEKLKMEKIESQEIVLSRTFRKQAIIVTDIDFSMLEEEFLKHYLEFTFADSEDIIHKCETWPSLNVAAVHFLSNHQEVVNKILTTEDHIALPAENYHIKIQPFFANFHDHINHVPMVAVSPAQGTTLNNDDLSDNETSSASEVESNNTAEESNTSSESENDHSSGSETMQQQKSEDDSSLEDESELVSLEQVNIVEADNKNTSSSTRYRGMGRSFPLSKPVVQYNEVESSEENNSDRASDDEHKEDFQSRQKNLVSRGRGLLRVKSGNVKKQTESSKNDLDNNANDHGDDQSSDEGHFSNSEKIDKRHFPFNPRGVKPKSRGSRVDLPNHKLRDNAGGFSRSKNIYHFKRKSQQGNTDLNFIADDFRDSYDESYDAVHYGHNMRLKLEPGEDNEHNFQERSNRGNTAKLRSNHQSSNHNKNFSYRIRGAHGGRHNHRVRDSLTKGNTLLPDNIRSQDTEVKTYNLQYKQISSTGQGDKQTNKKIKNYPVDSNYKKPHHRTSSKSREEKHCSELSTHLRSDGLNRPTHTDVNFSVQRKQLEEKIPECNEIEKLKMTPLQAKLLKSYMKAIDRCEVNYDNDQNIAVIRGPSQAVQKCQVDIMLKLREMKVDTITVSDEVRNILSTERGKHTLSDLISSEFPKVFLELDADGVKITAVNDIAFNEAAKAVKEKFGHTEIIKGKTDIPAEKIKWLKSIELKYFIKINWNSQNAEFEIQGIRDDVMLARKDVENFLQDFGIFEKSFDVGKPWAKYFYSCLKEQIFSILRPVKINRETITEHQIAIKFQGSREETNQVAYELEKLKGEIKCYPMNLTNEFKQQHEVFLICKSFQSGSLKDVVDKYKYKHKCLIDISNLSSFNLTSKATKKSKLPKSSKKSLPSAPQTIKTSAAQRESSSQKIIFDVSSTCQLVIKPYGDIVRERSDILVSVLTGDLDLRKTRTGISFNHKCRSHWREVKASFAQNFNNSVVTVKGPKGISCLAVCHVILEPWDPNNSDAKLSSSIHEVFNQARLLGAKTVSFPALGCGKMFKFPPSNFAQSMINAIKSLNIGNFLQKVVILAPEPSIFNELGRLGSSCFKRSQLPLQANNNASSDTSEESSDDSSDEDDVLMIDNSNGDKSQSTTDISIMTQNGENIHSLIKQIKKEITEKCLHTDHFKQDILKYWPGKSRKKIIENAKKLFVWVERSHSKTKHVGFILKGEKEAVNQMIRFIQDEFEELSSHLPKRRMYSSTAPKRGTIEFMRYASESDELFPSYWSLNESKTFLQSFKSLFSKKPKLRKLLVNVDKETKDAVTNIVMKTFESQLVGQGNDAVGLNHRAIKVVDVQRVENMELFEVYRDQRKRLFKRMVNMKHICPDIGKLPGSNGRVETSKYLSDAMKQELYYEVNEHYLLHGAKADTIDAIIHKGIDPKLASDEAMFGRGVYAAEKSTKSDQYTDSRNNRLRNGSNLKLILVRVLLGNVYLCDKNSKYVTNRGGRKLSRPPCMKCLDDKCKCTDPQFDSVMGDGGWLFREFVVYETNHCYPEYVITYQRL
ncbi:hypothetical protein Btru_024552 [Bulinus truncatus]|nr:hypothetical protein Btru_024552 [Bulinus truncatus]